MPSWPATLPPEPVLDSVKLSSPVNAISRSQMSMGPAKTRKRTTAAIRPISMTFSPLTDAQVAIFEAWHENDIGLGALSFTMTHPVSGVTKTFKFATVDDQYSVSVIGRDANSLGLVLEILP